MHEIVRKENTYLRDATLQIPNPQQNSVFDFRTVDT